jgi:UDP-GlcNAc:undecaprenyl-phosphate GlcNAc-1-phosphate transferase
MLSIILLGACSFVLSLLLTPPLRDFAIRCGYVDKPDYNRKIHQVAVPRIGGIPIVLAYAGSFGILMLLGVFGWLSVQLPLPLIWRLLPAALVVFLTGLVDDLAGLKPRQKLLGLTFAAVLACGGGLLIRTFAGYEIRLAVGLPLTILWLVACTNAFNLIDGVDGLASGVGLLATLTTMAAGMLHGDVGLVMATAPLAGALIGFLRFNFNPASIFLGDCGSLWVGFMLGCCGVIWSQKSATLLGITAPLMALSIPLLDMGLSIIRRFLRRQPIFGADQGHIHHRLLARGLTPRRVTLLLYAASGLAACFSLLQSSDWSGSGGYVIAAFCAVIWLGIQYLGYQEFGIAAGLLRQGVLRSMVQSQMSLRVCEESLGVATTVEQCWSVIRRAAREFGFSEVELQLAGRSYQEQMNSFGKGRWTLRIPLSEVEYVQLTRTLEPSTTPAAVGPLVDVLHRALSAKAVEFSRATQLTVPIGRAAGEHSYAGASPISTGLSTTLKFRR